MGHTFAKAAAGLIALASLVAFVRCSDNSLAPFQPEVTSATDNFQLQATGVKNVTSTLTYSWTNTGVRATINHSTATSLGTTRLIITDGGGAVVYERALAPSLSDTTAIGASGAWTIRLVLNKYSGTLNFRVQKL